MSSLFLFFVISATAAGTGDVNVNQKVETTPGQSIIVDTRKSDKSNAAAPKVEMGTDVLAGSPEDHPKKAYRTWEDACDAWKKDLAKLNRNHVLYRSCGKPEVKKQGSLFVYSSKSTYKIKVTND